MSEGLRVAAIVLAAGMSTRMGRPKMLLPLGNGTVLDAVLRNFQAAGNVHPVIVVTGAVRDEVEAVARAHAGVVTVHNPCYAEGGMLSSVKAGVGALPADVDAFFLALGDQPLVRPETLQALLSRWADGGASVFLPEYGGRRGHPVLFSAACAAGIAALPESATLKDFVAAEDVAVVTVPDPYILTDIDTPRDYNAALQQAIL